MESNNVARIVEALDGAISILRNAEGRRSAADIRLQSILAAARETLAARTRLEGHRRWTNDPSITLADRREYQASGASVEGRPVL